MSFPALPSWLATSLLLLLTALRPALSVLLTPNCRDNNCSFFCVDNTSCTSTCQGAGGVGAACDVACDRRYNHCACRGAAALLRTGTCNQMPAGPTCTPMYDAVFVVAAREGPELRATDLVSGNASTSLRTLLHHSLAAVLGIQPQELTVISAGLTNQPASFDLSFSFCVSEAANVSSAALEQQVFEVPFRLELQRYATFVESVIYLLSLTSRATTTTTTFTTSVPPPVATDSLSHDASDDESLMLAVIASCGFLTLLSLLVCLALQCRTKATVVDLANEDAEQGQSPSNASDSAVPVDVSEPAVVAKVSEAFHPGDGEDDKAIRGSFLDLEEGDAVEIIAGGGGWLYGRVVCAEGGVERAGYFPENRVSWYGRKLRHDRVSTVQDGMLVTPYFDFAAEDVEDLSWRNCCLAIKEGEVVEVMAAGGGWLYGRIAGSEPERAGYFPENRIYWLCSTTAAGKVEPPGEVAAEGEHSSGAAAEAGWLVKVGSSFSPGSPGDAEEEAADQAADFSACCLALAPGDVVEVAAGGGGWLYGRVVGAPDRVGFFPENRVCWVGRPVSDSESPQRHAVVTVAITESETGRNDSADIAALRSAAHEALDGTVPPSWPAVVPNTVDAETANLLAV